MKTLKQEFEERTKKPLCWNCKHGLRGVPFLKPLCCDCAVTSSPATSTRYEKIQFDEWRTWYEHRVIRHELEQTLLLAANLLAEMVISGKNREDAGEFLRRKDIQQLMEEP